ncbi:oligosaccharide flippase family protein, partial [Planctomycetota bacterium]
MRRKILMSAGSNWASTMVAAVIGLILVPVVLTAIGEKAYGIWALFAYGLAYPMILDSSFTLAINRFAAYHRNDTEQLNRFVSTSFLILAVLALLTLAASILLSFFVADIFSAVTADMAGQAKITCILVGATFALKMLESTFSGALQGFLYYSRYNLVIIISNILRAVFVIVFLLFRRDAVTVQSGYMISAVISAVLMYIVARKSIPGLQLKFALITKKILLDLFRHTIHSIARSGSLILMFNTLTLLVGWAGSASDVTVYTIACRLPGFVRGLLAGAQNVFLPAVTGLHAQGKIDIIKRVITKGTHISSVLTCAGCILLFVFAKEL